MKPVKQFLFFYSYLKLRILLGLVLSMLVGLLDGLGLAMFLPLIKMIDGENISDSGGMGNLKFIAEGIEYLGLELNFMVVMLSILLLFILKGIFKLFEGLYNVKVSQFFVRSIRHQCINMLAEFGYKGFIQSDSGRIQNTLSGEVTRVVNAYNNYRMTLQNTATVFVYLILAFLSNPKFALFVAIGAFFSNLIFSAIYKKTKKLSKAITKYGHSYQGLLIQAVAFFKYLKATGRFEFYANKMRYAVDDIEKTNKKIGYINSYVGAVREPVVMTIVIGVIIFQVKVLGESLALLILSLLFFQRALNFVMAAQTNWNGFLASSGAIENLNEFLNELNFEKEKRGNEIITKIEKEIILDNISFKYNVNNYTLKNISLQINKNKTIAFVGESGSGKTTLVNIIAGLLTLEEGELIISGINAKKLDLRTFQNKIGYITQEPVIFNDDVYNNVTFWDERTPENLKRFWDALSKASIYEFINELPEKEKSPLGNNGIMVSGGQKQRISIARELYKNVDILIMDEATSSLDSETERAIQENIDSLKGKYTILIIAHRLSTIKNADTIVILNKGQIMDQGSFNELTQRNNYFEKMVRLQEL